jgi:site-specific DNA recombinase
VTVLPADFATVWNELFPAEQARIVQLLVERVVVSPEGLEIRLRAEGLHSLVEDLRLRESMESEAA